MDGKVTRYRTEDLPVGGGMLRIGVWDAPAADAPTVLLVHGVTASHLSWPAVAERLTDARVVAPDLRGRGRSNTLVGPAGLAAHARDLAAVLDVLDVSSAVVVGHSMGAFVALALGELYPDRVSRLVLVDGGLPLDLSPGLSPDEMIRLVLGPTAERLSMRFESVDAYLDFWRQHPAFAHDWSLLVEAYLEYDLVGEAPQLRPATSYDVVVEDSIDQNSGTVITDALAALRRPTMLLTAERGLLDQVPALYSTERLLGMLADYPGLRHEPIAGVNHYTIVLSERGADAVAAAVREEIAAIGR